MKDGTLLNDVVSGVAKMSSVNVSDVPERSSLLERQFLCLSVKNWLRLSALVALIAIVVVAFVVFNAEERLEDLLEWIDDNQAPGFFIFVLAYCLATGKDCLFQFPV